VTDDLTNFVKLSLARGVGQGQIEAQLLAVGWRKDDVNRAFLAVGQSKLLTKTRMLLALWLVPLVFATGLLALFNVYEFFYEKGFSLLALCRATAAAAALMIGISFAFSSLGYYLRFFATRLSYRKYFGLVGYYLALLYSFMLLFVDPARYFFGFSSHVFSADFILGLLAMAIFSLMALVSNNWWMRKLGPGHWRLILRMGYLAYGMLIIRAVILEGGIWLKWFLHFDGLPPARLIVSVFAIAVILLRLMMALSIHFKKGRPSLI
jgi:DMSO/TMAO reductase YedYZ heme-binding membrane subunit